MGRERTRRRRAGGVLAALALLLMAGTWSAATTAAAQPTTVGLAFALPPPAAWMTFWPPRTILGESILIAAVGSVLMAIAATVRRAG